MLYIFIHHSMGSISIGILSVRSMFSCALVSRIVSQLRGNSVPEAPRELSGLVILNYTASHVSVFELHSIKDSELLEFLRMPGISHLLFLDLIAKICFPISVKLFLCKDFLLSYLN